MKTLQKPQICQKYQTKTNNRGGANHEISSPKQAVNHKPPQQ
ncbi:hypothetical protein [Bizionia myxarmorum]|nr:hypothetical protein [Bizionia myxarmorum]